MGIDISVLTQNLRFLPAILGGSSIDIAEKYGNRLAGLGDNIPDIIGLTETFTEEYTNAVVTKIEATHPHQLRSFPTPLPDGKIGNSGLTLLSKFPIEAHEFRMFAECGGTDCLASKGVLIALIRLPASFVVVSVTHLNAVDTGSKAIFESQLNTVRDLIREFVSTNIPASALDYSAVLSIGDFNIASDSKLYDTMINTIGFEVEDPHKTLNPDEDGFTSDASNPTQRLDYILNLKSVGNSGEYAFPSSNVIEYAVDFLVLPDLLSDHLGVKATISIDKSPTNNPAPSPDKSATNIPTSSPDETITSNPTSSDKSSTNNPTSSPNGSIPKDPTPAPNKLITNNHGEKSSTNNPASSSVVLGISLITIFAASLIV